MSSIYTIAEIAQAHDGSLGILHSYIDALANTGVNAIKFQTHIANAESSEYEPFRIKFSYQDLSRFDYWKRMEFTVNQWEGIKAHCEQCGLEFMSSPFSIAAIDLLEEIEVNRYKIGSGEINNYLLLEKIAKTGKPIILSSGLSSYDELDHTVSFLKKFDTDLSILQCTTSYPTTPQQWGLNVISELKTRYAVPVGFSDHSGDIFACLAAVSLGADLLEFHVTFDKRMFGPDTVASISIDKVSELLDGVAQIYEAINSPVDKSENNQFYKLKNIFEKSLAVNKDLAKGHVIIDDDLETKKPADKGIPASRYSEVIGKKLKVPKAQWDFLNFTDLQQE